MLELAVGAILLLCVVAYGVLGGADFGGGVWDLLASGPTRAAQRQAIAHAMGPVWEANHVWLIFVIVLLFAAFPPAYAAISVALFWPFHLALLGITLRGAAFVFRGYGPCPSTVRWGAVFGAASAITPVLLGLCLGAVSAGTLRAAGPASTWAWLGPLPLLVGALALCLCAYLAAVFLTVETEGALRDSFRRRALLAGTAVVTLSAALLPVLGVVAPHLLRGLLFSLAAPVVAVGAAAALLSGSALLRRRYPLARAAAVVQVGCLLGGWGLALHPHLVYPDLTLHAAAAPPATLRLLLLSLLGGAIVLVPSLWLLFQVFKGRPGQDGHGPRPLDNL